MSTVYNALDRWRYLRIDILRLKESEKSCYGLAYTNWKGGRGARQYLEEEKMVQYCVAYGCKTLYDKRNNIQFHSFPFKRPEILQLWLNAIKRKDWEPSKSSRLCSKHFKETDYQNRVDSLKKILKLDAVPSIFDFPKHLQKQAQPRRQLIRSETKAMCVEDQAVENMKIFCEPILLLKDVATQTNFNQEVDNVVLKRKLKTMKQKLQRKVKKIETMQEAMELLKQEALNLLDDK